MFLLCCDTLLAHPVDGAVLLSVERETCDRVAGETSGRALPAVQ